MNIDKNKKYRFSKSEIKDITKLDFSIIYKYIIDRSARFKHSELPQKYLHPFLVLISCVSRNYSRVIAGIRLERDANHGTTVNPG